MKIRKAKLKDIEQLLKIGRKTEEFEMDKEESFFWSKEQLTNWIKSKDDVTLLAEKDNKIIGFILMAHHVPTGKVTWENAWVDPTERGKSIAKKLYTEAEKKLKRNGAIYICGMTKPSSKLSIKMQEKVGFKQGLKFIWMGKLI